MRMDPLYAGPVVTTVAAAIGEMRQRGDAISLRHLLRLDVYGRNFHEIEHQLSMHICQSCLWLAQNLILLVPVRAWETGIWR